MNSCDLLFVDVSSVLERKSDDSLRSVAGDEFDGLHNSRYDNMFNSRVFALSVLSNQDSVDIFVRGLVTLDRSAWSNVGVKVEGSSKGQVQRDVSLSDGSRERTLECDGVLADRLNSGIRDSSLAILENRRDVALFPFDGNLGGTEDVDDRFLRA